MADDVGLVGRRVDNGGAIDFSISMTRRYPTSIRFGGGFRVDCATASRSVDTTVREHWARARKVDIHGNDVAVAEDSPLSDAEWAKHHHSLATMALPNGYCGLLLQQRAAHIPTRA